MPVNHLVFKDAEIDRKIKLLDSSVLTSPLLRENNRNPGDFIHSSGPEPLSGACL